MVRVRRSSPLSTATLLLEKCESVAVAVDPDLAAVASSGAERLPALRDNRLVDIGLLAALALALRNCLLAVDVPKRCSASSTMPMRTLVLRMWFLLRGI
jgi:hypothetical protein